MGKSSLIKSKYLKNIRVYYLTDYIFISLIKVMYFENLQKTDIKKLNFFVFTRRAKTKSRIKIKKEIKKDLIDCKNP